MKYAAGQESGGPESWMLVAAGGVRVAFGVVMAIDAALKWRPAFASHYLGYLENASRAQPAWLGPWYHFWLTLVHGAPGFFVQATRILETAIAAGLLLGAARRLTYLVGALFSLLIWATAEGFGGPYTAGATNIGPALVYALLFVALAGFAWMLGGTPYSLDYHLERRFPGWASWAELAPERLRRAAAPVLTRTQQIAVVALVGLIVVLAAGSLRSATEAAPPTPSNAAAAVTPLSLYTGAPTAHAMPAVLPPLIGTGDRVQVTLVATDATVEIASGVRYQAWTFNGSVPGPILHVRQGQTVDVTFLNKGFMAHSIDFHAAEVAPSVDYRSVQPGESLRFSFQANTPGAFIYHCGTPPTLLHIGNGMYGALIVDPLEPLPRADASYVLVQAEWYTQQVSGSVLGGDFDKMMAGAPDEVVFNGEAFQYRDHPLSARAGQRVRWYFINAGPNFTSAFHLIGSIFSAVYVDGDMSHPLTGVSTYPVAPGQGVVCDNIMRQAGDYTFVDHGMRDMEMGAVGSLRVAP